MKRLDAITAGRYIALTLGDHYYYGAHYSTTDLLVFPLISNLIRLATWTALRQGKR